MPHKPAISTCCLGWHPSHTLERKLAAIKQAGFQGVEIFIWDIELLQKTDGLDKIEACRKIKDLVADNELEILSVASFDEFEAQATSIESRLATAKEWIAMAQALGTDLVQIPSAAVEVVTADDDIIIGEFQTLADLGAKESPPIRFAFEALGWGKNCADWEESLRYVQLVDRPNFGVVLDTYHILGRLWADFRSPSGRRNGGDAALQQSLRRFLDDFPREKLFYIQLSDAERLQHPILPGHEAYDANKDGVHSMCMYGRIYPMEAEYGAYLPMQNILLAFLRDSGWKGWCSMEIFQRRTMEKEENGPEFWADRARKSWTKVLDLITQG